MRSEDDPPGVYYLEKGYVRVYSISEEGKEFTLNIFKPQSYFPAMWALGDIPNYYYHDALTSVEVRLAPKEEVIAFVKSNPDELWDLTKRLLSGLNGLLTRMEYLLSSDACHKVASVILMSAKRFGRKERSGVLIELPLTHQDVASLAGVTRETASVEIGKLSKKGIVEKKNGFMFVADMRKLVKESQLYNDGKPLPYTF